MKGSVTFAAFLCKKCSKIRKLWLQYPKKLLYRQLLLFLGAELPYKSLKIKILMRSNYPKLRSYGRLVDLVGLLNNFLGHITGKIVCYN